MGEPLVLIACRRHPSGVDMRYTPAGSTSRKCDCVHPDCAAPSPLSPLVGQRTIREDATARTLELVAEWLEKMAAPLLGEAKRWPHDSGTRDTLEKKGSAMMDMATAIRRGEPMRWAEERGRG